MLNIRGLSAVLFVVLACSYSFGQPLSALKGDLEKIDKKLSATVSSDGLQENLRALRNLADHPEQTPLFGKSYTGTVKKLVSLSDVKCDKEQVDFLKELNKSLGSGTYRINEIINQLSEKHAKDCQSVYARMFEAKIDRLDQGQVRLVNKLIATTIKDTDHETGLELVSRMRTLLIQLLDENETDWREGSYSENIYNALARVTRDTENYRYLKRTGNGSVDEKNLRDTFNKYVINPCKYYVENLRADIFELAKQDGKFHHIPDESGRSLWRNYYFGWYRSEVCHQMLKHESALFDDIKSIASRRN